MINELDEKEKKWFAIYTKFKCEKYVGERLAKMGIESYIPLIKKTKYYVSKKKEYHVPLINCYAFVYISKEEYLKVLQTEYVIKFIRIGEDLIAIPHDEIDLLKRIVGELEESVSLYEGDLVIGQKVEIIAGQLTGIKGTLVKQKNSSHFVVKLEKIMAYLQVDVDINLLRPYA